jgi:putative ABC transport system permease protein
MSVIWYKVWRDLTQNRTRTLLVVLSIAVGVFALGLVFGLSAVMRARMTQDYQSTLPAHLAFGGSSFSQEIVEGIRRGPGVAEAEGVTQAMIRWKLPGETEWRRGNLVAREDYYVQQLDRMTLVDGAWPEGRALAIERQSARYFRIPSGSTVLVEVGRREREMPVQGVTRALGVTPPQFGGDATFYATADTVAWIAGMSAPNRLSVRMAAFDQQQAEALAEDIEGRLARMGASVVGYRVMDPNVHPLHDLLDTLTVVLTVLSLLALGLSVFLIANTMSAIVLQQVWQIGVMKVLGATSRQVMRLYLGMALAYGLLALGVAWPLSVLTTHWVAGMLLRMINVGQRPLPHSVSAVGDRGGSGAGRARAGGSGACDAWCAHHPARGHQYLRAGGAIRARLAGSGHWSRSAVAPARGPQPAKQFPPQAATGLDDAHPDHWRGDVYHGHEHR